MIKFIKELLKKKSSYTNFQIINHNGDELGILKIRMNNLKNEDIKNNLECLFGDFEDGVHMIDGWGRDLYVYKNKSSGQNLIIMS